MSTKWSSSMIEIGKVRENRMTDNMMRPLIQIFSYCVMNETRYGFIITDSELVVVRVRIDQEIRLQKSSEDIRSSQNNPQECLFKLARSAGVLDCKSIPWTAHSNGAQTSDRMTANLAL